MSIAVLDKPAATLSLEPVPRADWGTLFVVFYMWHFEVRVLAILRSPKSKIFFWPCGINSYSRNGPVVRGGHAEARLQKGGPKQCKPREWVWKRHQTPILFPDKKFHYWNRAYTGTGFFFSSFPAATPVFLLVLTIRCVCILFHCLWLVVMTFTEALKVLTGKPRKDWERVWKIQGSIEFNPCRTWSLR